MEVSLINLFAGATERVFQLAVGCEVVPDPPKVFATLPPDESAVNAVITLRGGACGVVMLRFPTEVILPLGKAFARTEVTLDDAYDAIGELANMVTGSAKRELSQTIVDISAPRVAVGDKELGDILELSPWLYVPLKTSLGRFYLSLSISEQN